ncbi:abortive infection protein [Comamonas sp. Y33R10-2]|uniref:abortive infection protein n=1 Tax=Comamonas sp. Y33R10-2 TaxID=2853257 RepID=UPI002104732B|nr:abortive infection protein [Comamonas sp. Y33R10-2]
MSLVLWLLGMPGAVALAWSKPALWWPVFAPDTSVQSAAWMVVLGLGVLLALAIGIGLKLGSQVGLSSPLVHAAVQGRTPWRGMRVLSLPGLAGGVAGAAWMVTLTMVWPESMAFVAPVYDLPLLPKILYGGFTEELLLRFGLLSLVMWLLWRALGSPEQRPSWQLGWLAIFIAAVLSGGILVYLGWTAVAAMTATALLQLLACEVVYGLLSGILFWRYGLESAMLAHVVTYLLSHGLV